MMSFGYNQKIASKKQSKKASSNYSTFGYNQKIASKKQ
jgi:hypothetical protein